MGKNRHERKYWQIIQSCYVKMQKTLFCKKNRITKHGIHCKGNKTQGLDLVTSNCPSPLICSIPP